MGAGHSYSYDNFMLIDLDHDYFQDTYDNGETEFNPFIYEDFLINLCNSINATPITDNQFVSRNVYDLFSTDNAIYSLDSSGGMPCIFTSPILDSDEQEEDERFMYEYTKHVKKSFSIFIQDNPGVFRYPTSSWTSEPY